MVLYVHRLATCTYNGHAMLEYVNLTLMGGKKKDDFLSKGEEIS